MDTLDTKLFYALYHFAGISNWGDRLILFFGDYFIYVLILVFLAFLYRDFQRTRFQSLKLYMFSFAAALFARYGVASFIRIFVHRPRPFLALSLPHLINDTAYSFPSGHTIFIFALATGVLFFNRKLAYFFYASGLLVALARVAGGVHYPSDIVGGALLGIATTTILYFLCKYFYPQLLKSN